MTDKNRNSEIDSTLAQRLGTWLKNTHQVATAVGCIDAIEPVLQMLKKIGRDSINITFIGSPNSGKSKLLNHVLDRSLLPVTVLSSNRQFSIQGNADQEGFVMADDAILHPLEDLHKNDLFPELSTALVNIYLSHQWLDKNRFHLIEKPSLDVSEEGAKDAINLILEETDCAVLVIDAQMPLRRAEVQFMFECVRRGIPIVAGLSKVDKLFEEERGEVITYVTNQAESYSPSIRVIPTNFQVSGHGGIDDLKTSIQELIDETDIVFIRAQQVMHTLLKVIGVIYSAAQTRLEVQQKSESERNLELKQRQQQIDSNNLTWQRIEQNLDSKRRIVDGILREHLQNNQASILEVLLYELQRSNDIKTWWERDFPFRLEKEIKSLAGQLSKVINQHIISDLQWLQEEVSQQFKYPFQDLAEPIISVDTVAVEQREMSLSNSNSLKIIARVGTAVSIILAGTILVPLGFSSAGLAASVIAGLTAEQILRWNTVQDREKIRSELRRVIEKAELAYAQEASRQLKQAYNQVISDLKQHQLRWQQAQLQALMQIKQKPVIHSDISLEQVVQRIDQLVVEIKAEINL